MGGGYDSVKAIKGKFSAARYSERMNADLYILQACGPSLDQFKIDEAHRMRSQVIDAFATLERAVVAKAREAGVSVTPNCPLADKLSELTKAPFKSVEKANQRIADAKQLVHCRNDIVHSEIGVFESVGSLAGTYYLFQNIATSTSGTGILARILAADEFSALPAKIKGVAKRLSDQQLKATAPTAPSTANGQATPPTPQ